MIPSTPPNNRRSSNHGMNPVNTVKVKKIKVIAIMHRIMSRDAPTATNKRGVIGEASIMPRNCTLACRPIAPLEWPWLSNTIAISGMVSPNVSPKIIITEITAARLRTVVDGSPMFLLTGGAACGAQHVNWQF